MAKTSYGHFLVEQKRYLERTYQKMSAMEKADFKRKMAEIYKVQAEDKQSVPPSLTLV